MGVVLSELASGSPAAAQPVAPVCSAPVAATGELAPWSAGRPVNAAANAKDAEAIAIGPGQAVVLTLLQTPSVQYALQPEKPGGTVSYGGLIGVDIPVAGNYRVALGSGAWIDMVGGGRAIESTAHGHGPDCTGIRKMVDFPLSAGHYLLQLSANGSAQTEVLVARQP